MDEVEDCVYEALRNAFEAKPVFGAFFYTVNESNNVYTYRKKGQNMKSLEIPKAIATENICEYEGKNETKIWSDFVGVLH